MKTIRIFLIFSFILLAACARQESGIDVASLDQTVRPQDDFYRYVNGNWLTKTEIPPDKSDYGSFTVLFDKSEMNLKAIIEQAAEQPNKKAGSEVQKVGDFYLSYIDSARVEELALQPVEDELERIKNLKSKTEVLKHFAYLQKVGTQVPFKFFVDQDLKKSNEYIGYLAQSGLGLPDREYYFKKENRFKTIREKYRAYIKKIFTLTGAKDVDEKVERIVEIETEIAKNHWTRVQNRDPHRTYNKFELARLKKLTPAFDWGRFLEETGVENVDALIVQQPSYFQEFNTIFNLVSTADWKTYLTWKLLDGAAPLLNAEFAAAHFDFRRKTLSGVETMRPRWKRAVAAVDASLGEVVGKIYVSKHFKRTAKRRMQKMVDNLKFAFKERIEGLEWMREETKQEALAKLERFNTKIGYPDKWKDYSALEISKDDLVGNVKRSNLVEYQRMIAKLEQPVDRDEWFMTPQTVSACYNPPMNEVVFPAAILQPPFFNLAADDAVNYGAIGAVIGHEISHAFDDQGRKTDGEGNLRDWWTREDEAEFKKRARAIVKQYAKYRPIDSMPVNGKLTLGENIGDLAGLTVAYKAYKRSLKGRKAPIIDGFTGDQRFFIGWAQVWRCKYRDDELRRRLLTDPHAPGECRTNGVVANMPEFYEAFEVKEGDGLYKPPESRVNIW
ncbi:MAG: M13 family metallopeptidase [bacterium]